MKYNLCRNKNTNRNVLMDMLMIFISNKIRYVFIFALGLLWFGKASGKNTVLNALKSAAVTLLIHAIIKKFYFKPRPFMERDIDILIPSKRDSSFPSKHTLLVFAISTSFILCKRFVGFILLGLSVLTGISRIWLGHHYTFDIIGSAVIGSLTSMIIHIFSRFKRFGTGSFL
ncbi:undecaprenyl-diphosphatase [Chengkuizengella axinellae]|uniref:Undecaprenyl-diphosphatase n=1 Tax=Chengkuizengella axinellae TaxID=3064388 RepID=A0ABT9J1L6_9BACL|nr:undecaprenyl-diphosphatase [Chengkuizengella sp. 2205SS18-9]MDP5275312.1 undecaprenyl-diphosphatase [Chengkuizengella sp. 2205SS18-9]